MRSLEVVIKKKDVEDDLPVLPGLVEMDKSLS